MSEHIVETAAPAEDDSYHFLITRLHSLTGLVPIGAYLIIHLATNARIWIPGDYQKAVDQIHSLGPLLLPVEIVFIFLPLLFHSIIGFQIIFSGKANARYYPYRANIRYTLQRITGIIAFFFIVYHVLQLHWLGKPLGGGKFDPHDAAGSARAAIQAAWWIAPVYAIGVLASVYHLANGIWTSLITWGITIRPKSQQVAGYVCAAFGIVLSLVGLGALNGFRTLTGNNSPGASSHAERVEHGN